MDSNSIIDEEMSYDLTDVCNAFGLYEPHALFLVSRNKEKPEYNGRQVIIEHEGRYRLSYAGIIWLITQGCQFAKSGDIGSIINMISSFYTDKNRNEKEFRELAEKYNILHAKLTEINRILNEIPIMKKPVKKSKSEKEKALKKKKWTCKKNDPDLAPLTETESAWINDARKRVYDTAAKYKTQYAIIIKKIYHIMETEYSVD